MEIKITPVEINGKTYHPELGTIKDTMLGIEDHGILTSFIYIDFLSGWTQGAGGYSLDSWDSEANKRTGAWGTATFIRETLEVVGVDRWEKLKGKKVIALREPGFNGHIRGLASANNSSYVMFEDCFAEDVKRSAKEKNSSA